MENKFRKYTKEWIKKESQKKKEERAKQILSLLKKHYSLSKMFLKYNTQMQLLVAVILSAQCTDKKVNEVTKTLFKKYKTPKDFANVKKATFEREIRPTGFYKSKAKNIISSAKLIEKKFKGRLPKTMEEMLELSGVARKTANIVLFNTYGIIEGIAVDTHVARISQRLGLTKTNDPKKIEQDLMGLFPKKEWGWLTYKVISHGRNICTARNKKCKDCPLNKICPSSLV